MESSKNRRWVIGILIFAIIILFAFLFWDAILIRVAPKAVLSTALTDVFAQLEARFQNDPLWIILNTIDPEGAYTADVVLKTDTEQLGPVTYDMILQTDTKNHRFLADGTVSMHEKQLDLSLYLDTEFMAVSSDDLSVGNYYGITYESFLDDIRSIPLLGYFISDSILSQWDASVQNIRTTISKNYTAYQVPKISREDMNKMILGLLTLPCEVENRAVPVDSIVLDCQAVTYRFNSDQMKGLPMDMPFAENAAVQVIFYLHKNTLVKAQLCCTTDNDSTMYGLTLGMNPSEGILRFQRIQQSDGKYDDCLLFSETHRSDDIYTQTWNFCRSTGEQTAQITLNYNWEPTSGKLDLRYNGAAEPIQFVLIGTESGFQIQTEHFSELIPLIIQDEQIGNLRPISGIMNVAKGARIAPPDYKNLDQWSIEDLFTLLTGVGTLFGINIGI